MKLIAEYDGSNAMLRRYVFGPGADEPIVWYEGSGTTDRRFLHQDERGTVVAVTNSSGTTLSVNTYDEYGKPGSSNTGRFQYTGQSYLPELASITTKRACTPPASADSCRPIRSDTATVSTGMGMFTQILLILATRSGFNRHHRHPMAAAAAET